MTITLKDVGSGFKRTALKENFDTIQAELNDNVLTKTGGQQLEADLDMNSNKLLNVASGVLNTDGVNLQQLNGAIVAAGSGLVASQREVQTGAQVVSLVTTFTGITYTVSGNNLFIFLNGNYQTKDIDYTETSPSSITWLKAINSTDAVVAITNLSTTNTTADTAGITHSQSGTSYNLATYLQNRNEVNVKDFGAVGDGVTDDSAAFAAAKASLPDDPTNAYLSGTLYAPAGAYYLASGVDLLSLSGSIGLVGDGQGYTHIIGGENKVCLDNVGHVVRDLNVWSKTCWDSSVAAGSPVFTKDTRGRGIWAEGRPRLERVTMYGFGGEGLYAPRMTNGVVDTVRITGCGKGIHNAGLITVDRKSGSDAVGNTITTGFTFSYGTVTVIKNGTENLVLGVDYTEPTTSSLSFTVTPSASDTFRFLVSTVTTTSVLRECYISSCTTGMELTRFTHGIYSNNICEAGTNGLVATSCSGTVWEGLYFEGHTNQHYIFLNCSPVISGRAVEVSGGVGAPALASQNLYNASISSTDMAASEIQPSQMASTHLGMLSYDSAPNSEKGLIFNRFKMTGPGSRFRGLRVLDRDTDSGKIDAVGTFTLVNGAKAAHTSIVQVKADGTVLDSDGMISSVTKLATGEYSLNLVASTHPDHVSIATYQVYATGATPVRNPQWSMTSANLTTHETGRSGVVQKIYVTITDATGTLQDSGFTATIMWNLSNDLTS